MLKKSFAMSNTLISEIHSEHYRLAHEIFGINVKMSQYQKEIIEIEERQAE